MRKIAAVLLFVGFFFTGYSSNNRDSLRFELPYFNPAPINLGDVRNDTLWLFNTATQNVFNGQIVVNYSVNGGVPFQAFDSAFANPNGGLSLASNNVINNLVPGDSIPLAIIFNFSGPQLLPGSSIVVIWPSAGFIGDTIYVADSVTQGITVHDTATSGINNINTQNLKVYMDEQQLWIQNNDGISLREVRLYDVLGRLIQTDNSKQSGSIPTNGYADGIYMVQVTLADNRQQIFKVVKASLR